MKDKDAQLMMEGMYKVKPNPLEEPEGTPANPGRDVGMIVQTLQQIYDEFRNLPEQPPAAAYAILQRYMAEPTTATAPAQGDSKEDIANALKGMFTTTDQGLQFKN
tara:strand:+ start:728 stop:1045 length:318 start_codon:yes stop_codon:yes gene_type:complete